MHIFRLHNIDSRNYLHQLLDRYMGKNMAAPGFREEYGISWDYKVIPKCSTIWKSSTVHMKQQRRWSQSPTK